MIVLDASAALTLLLRTTIGERIEHRVFKAEGIHAPALIDLEVAQTLRRFVRTGVLSAPRAADAIEAWLALDVERHVHEALVRRVWSLRANLTAYDAAYVALAESLQAPLVTCDRKLVASAGHKAAIELFADDA